MKPFILLFLIAFNALYSQVNGDTTNILQKRILSAELSFGGSLPFGSFSKRVKNESNSGFANPGIKLDASVNYQIYKNLGIKSMVSYQNHGIDDLKFKKDLILENPSNSYTIQSSAWENTSVLFGAFANFNADEAIQIQPKVLLGFNYGRSPVIDLTVSDSTKALSQIKQYSGNAFAFCYVLGLDLKLKLLERTQLLLGGDVFNSDLVFESVKVENKTALNTTTFRIKQPIQTFTIKFGVCRTF